jgi:starch synthase
VHAHDWHAGLAPAYIAQNPALNTATVFTIHNLAFRGLFPLDHHNDLGLLISGADQSALEFHGQLSFMKAALCMRNASTPSVRPMRGKSVRRSSAGGSMDCCVTVAAICRAFSMASTIRYGIRAVTARWRRTTRPTICVASGSASSSCKRNSASRVGAKAPLFAVVSRLTSQKGMDLVLGALPRCLAAGGQLVVIGSGEADIEAAFRAAAAAHPGLVSVHLGYDDALSHRIMAGADILLVPSRFEPCGLTQLYALRYGTLPLVRRVGGLADTVIDATPENLRAGTANGFVFDDARQPCLARRIATP